MSRKRVLASLLAITLLMLIGDCELAASQVEPINLNVSLQVETWASWVIPTNPITLSSTGDARSGSIGGVAFGSNNPDGFYIVAEMDNSGHLVNSNGVQLASPMEVKLPEMIEAEPMTDASMYGYPDLGLVNHMYQPSSYSGDIGILQEISPSDTSGDYSGILSVFMTYSIGNSTD